MVLFLLPWRTSYFGNVKSCTIQIQINTNHQQESGSNIRISLCTYSFPCFRSLTHLLILDYYCLPVLLFLLEETHDKTNTNKLIRALVSYVGAIVTVNVYVNSSMHLLYCINFKNQGLATRETASGFKKIAFSMYTLRVISNAHHQLPQSLFDFENILRVIWSLR